SSKISDTKLMKIIRYVMIAVSAVTLSLALWQPPAIFWISIFAATLFAASWGPAAFASILWKRVTKTGAFWSITVGSIGVAVTEILNSMGILNLPAYLNSAVFGGILSIIALIIGSLLTEPDRKSTRLNSSHVSISYA